MNPQKSNRPQEPQPPFPYHQEEVSFENKKDKITLVGTLTLPDKKEPFPAVLLIAGMGPNDRDYNLFEHKLFLLLADYLTKKGIAVLRYDKRGVGKSTGTFDATLTSEDFASDALAGIAYLKTRNDINPHNIGLIGHSEGGMIASIIAAQSPDISFIILMAGAFIKNIEHIIEQVALQMQADSANDKIISLDKKIRKQLLEIVQQEKDLKIAEEKLHDTITNYLENLTEEQKQEIEKLPFAIKEKNAEDIIKIFNSPWYRYFIIHDPITTLAKVTIPVLAVYGDLDFITSPRIIFPIIEQGLKKAKNKDYKIIALSNLNHWFQTCKKGSLAEYGIIEETMSPLFLETVSHWILEKIKK